MDERKGRIRMKTHVCSGYDLSTLLARVDDALSDGFRPTVALAFCSVALDVSELGRRLAERELAVVGVTTAGEIANAEMLEESGVVMLMEVDPDAFAVRFGAAANGSSLADLGRALGHFAVTRYGNPVVLAFGSGVDADGEDVVRGVRAGAGRPIPLFGGMAGDDLIMDDTYVFSNDGATEEGVVGLVLDGDRFQIEGLATSGWQPVGVEKTITRSDGNVVYTIDGKPALDVYRQYLNVEVDDAPADVATAIGVQYPLSLRRADGTSVIRAPLLYNAEIDALVFAGTVPEGAKVKFCIPPSLDIVDQVIDEAADVRACLPDADALVLISCKARHLALGPLAQDEIQGLHDLWNVPMLGFFSYGEIGARVPQHCDFHTETCTLVALREIRE